MAAGFRDTLVGGLKAAFTGIKSFVSGAVDKLMSKLEGLWDFFLKVKEIAKYTPAGLVAQGVGKLADVAFRAEGGPVAGGSPYIVGEQGPELFVPKYNGSIVPNHAMGGGGGMVIHQHFNGNMDMAARAALKNMKPELVRWAVAGVNEHNLRTV